MKHVCEEKIAEYLKSINTFLTKLEEKALAFIKAYEAKRKGEKYNEKDLKIQERIPNAKLIEVNIDNDQETEDEE